MAMAMFINGHYGLMLAAAAGLALGGLISGLWGRARLRAALERTRSAADSEKALFSEKLYAQIEDYSHRVVDLLEQAEKAAS